MMPGAYVFTSRRAFQRRGPERYQRARAGCFLPCGRRCYLVEGYIEQIGGFDEMHFAYLVIYEDVGVPGQIGDMTMYTVRRLSYHVGSGNHGSKYNFKANQ